jgi:hypothetical protein
MSDGTEGIEGWAEPEHFNEVFRLIGQYMFYWGALESEASRGVQTLLGLSGLSGVIATANITIRDKLFIIRTLVALYTQVAPSEAKEADKFLITIADMAGERNVVAHTMFGPETDGGVRFFAIRAKGKLVIPDEVWSPTDFDAKCTAMNAAKERLAELIKATAKRKAASAEPPTARNLFALGPRPMTDPQDPISDPPRLAEAIQRFGGATPETGPQTLPKKRASKPKAPRPKAKG